jgi:hypothetical protein
MEMATTICILGAIYLAANDQEGWGWLIFAAILISINT